MNKKSLSGEVGVLVGITASTDNSEESSYLNLSYSKTFTNERMVSVIIPSFNMEPKDYESPNTSNAKIKEWASKIIERLDILVLSGGNDINPVTFKNRNQDAYSVQMGRDLSEQALFEAAIDKGIPILGICRGMQLIGQLMGLTNFQQDLAEFGEKHSGGEIVDLRFEPLHPVKLLGPFKEFCGADEIMVNSFHHQGFTFHHEKTNYTKSIVAQLESKHQVKILAHTDQVIEAFEHKTLPIMAVQWHPEEVGIDSVVARYFFNVIASRAPIGTAGPTMVEKVSSH